MALKRRARRIVEEINPQNGDSIMDVGCGDGFYLYLFSNLGLKAKLVGIDYDENALKSASQNLKNKKVKFFKADVMERLPFKSKTFDKIVISEVVEHLPSDTKGLKEINRVLKYGGIMCLTAPNARYPLSWDPVNWILERFFGSHIKSGFWAGIWNQHLRLYTPEKIEHVVKKAGFKVEKEESLTYWCLPFNHYIANLVARKIHSRGAVSKVSLSLNKFKNKVKKPLWIRLAFGMVNYIDKINDLLPVKNRGVCVFVKARK